VFYWYLYQDGTITLEIKLTGELSTNCLSPGEAFPEYGTLVDPYVSRSSSSSRSRSSSSSSSSSSSRRRRRRRRRKSI